MPPPNLLRVMFTTVVFVVQKLSATLEGDEAFHQDAGQDQAS